MSSNIVPFKHKTVNILDEHLVTACQWSRVAANIIQWLSFFVLIYVIVRRSPKMMGAYKWYIIWNVSHGMVLGTYVVLIQPYPLSPYTIIVLRGVNLWFQLPDEATRYIMHAGLLMFVGTIYTTVILFVFRWAQTTQNRFVPLMSNMKFYTLAYLIFMVAIILGGVIPMHAQVLTADQIKRGIRDVDPKVYEFLSKERTVFGFNADDGNEHYLIGVVSVCIVVAAFFGFLTYCTVSTYVYISKNKTTLHANTARLYTKLLNLLLMDVCIAVLMFFLPSLMFIIAQTFQFECLTSIATICLIVVIFNSLSTNFLILLYIRPYRHEFVSVMQLTLFNLSGKRLGKPSMIKRQSLFSQSYA